MTELAGPCGTAAEIPVPDGPDATEAVTWWLITAPGAHPLWSQYILGVVRLRPVPGMPDPTLRFDGATHELFVIAVDPNVGPLHADGLDRMPPYLTPVNIAEQFTATDDEMAQLARACAQGVVTGHLVPETADAPTLIREAWLTSMVKTLAHIRGEAHSP